jgi:hypothetical protein
MRKSPVVVAPPEMVRPPACVPSPTVDDASERNPDGSVRKPVESKVLVAVPPKYARSNTESCEVDASAKLARFVTLSVPAAKIFPALSIVVVAVPPK